MENVHIKFWLEKSGAFKKRLAFKDVSVCDETRFVMFFVLTLYLILKSLSNIKSSLKQEMRESGCLRLRAGVSFSSQLK